MDEKKLLKKLIMKYPYTTGKYLEEYDNKMKNSKRIKNLRN
jgi:hypothetical protein